MTDEAEVLEWLIQQQSTVGDEDIVESVDKDELDIMMRNVDYLLVLYHDRKKKSQKALNALESIDDDCDELGISFVEVDKMPRLLDTPGTTLSCISVKVSSRNIEE